METVSGLSAQANYLRSSIQETMPPHQVHQQYYGSSYSRRLTGTLTLSSSTSYGVEDT